MHTWPLYGVITLGAVTLARYGVTEKRSGDTLGASYVLAGLWAFTVISDLFIPHPYNQLFPTVDAVTCIMMALAWRKTLRPWKAALIVLFVTECLIHAGYFETGDDSFRAKYAYDLKLNLIYLLQLCCVANAGLRKAATRIMQRPQRSRLRGSARRPF